MFNILRKENVQEGIEEGKRIYTKITYINRKVKKQETLTPTEVYNIMITTKKLTRFIQILKDMIQKYLI